MNGRLPIVVLDCPDPRALACFCGALLSAAALARDPPAPGGGGELPGR
jgi:hypothetical protein